MSSRENIVIVGGGLSGLISAIVLNDQGFKVTVIEKKVYPFHRVCGEYISNEVIPFLNSLNINIDTLNPSHISRLRVSSLGGKTFTAKLAPGGFGISRFTFDNFLYETALSKGVNFILGNKVNTISFAEPAFEITLSDNSQIQAGLVIAAYGKRSNLDQKLSRSFFHQRSPFAGIKYHIKTNFPEDLIQLDLFEGGYCGTVKINDNRCCLCYLSKNKNLKYYGSIERMEQEILFKNPYLKERFINSDFLFDKPEVINEISFEKKSLIEEHILFCGDAAGMIAPLCGNGMAMAIHSASILTRTIEQFPNFTAPGTRALLEKTYVQRWNRMFSFRLKTGRLLQNLLFNRSLSSLTITSLNKIPSMAKFLIDLTHGKPFL